MLTYSLQLYHAHDICPPGAQEVTNTLVLGLIRRAHVRRAVLGADGTVDARRLRAVARLGGTAYARVGEGFELARPSWRAMREQVQGETGGDKGTA